MRCKIVARDKIVGMTKDEDLKAIDACWESDIEEFDDGTHEADALDSLREKYKDEIEKLFDPIITLYVIK